MLTGVSELLLHRAECRTVSGHELWLLGRSEFSHGAHGRFGVISITPLVQRSRWWPRCRASVRGWCDECVRCTFTWGPCHPLGLWRLDRYASL